MKSSIIILFLIAIHKPSLAQNINSYKLMQMREQFNQAERPELAKYKNIYFDCRSRSARRDSAYNGFFTLEIKRADNGQYYTDTLLANSDYNGVPLDLLRYEALGTMGEYPSYLLRIRATTTGLVIEKSIQMNWSDSYYLKPVGANQDRHHRYLNAYRVESYSTCEISKYINKK